MNYELSMAFSMEMAFSPIDLLLLTCPEGWVNEEGETVYEKPVQLIKVVITSDPASEDKLIVKFVDSHRNFYTERQLVHRYIKHLKTYNDQIPAPKQENIF